MNLHRGQPVVVRDPYYGRIRARVSQLHEDGAVSVESPVIGPGGCEMWWTIDGPQIQTYIEPA